jgi:phage gp46-like protein
MDISLKFNAQSNESDIDFGLNDLKTDNSLRTSVLLSLFTDRRADGERGWWADGQFGSELWRLRRSKMDKNLRELSKFYTEQALKWLIDDGIAKSISVTTETVFRTLKIVINIEKPDGDNVSFDFENIWSTHEKELRNGV